MRFGKVIAAILLATCFVQPALAKTVVKVAVLKFGTVNWELDVIKHHRLDDKHGIALEIVPLASTQATKIALQGRAADIAVTDWLWVSRQRAGGLKLALVPYSAALGAVMVAGASDIKRLADLKGKKLGIAGGPIDKSWLMLRAASRKSGVGDLVDQVEPVYGAPPLLAEKLRQGELDAVLNFWHFSARLEAEGYRRLIGMNEVITTLGGSGAIPMIGYTFHERWAEKNKTAVRGFIAAAAAARQIMARSDGEWRRLQPLTRAKDSKTLEALRDRFREGIPKRNVTDLVRDAGVLFDVLAKIGGKRLVGPGKGLAHGTFFRHGE